MDYIHNDPLGVGVDADPCTRGDDYLISTHVCGEMSLLSAAATWSESSPFLTGHALAAYRQRFALDAAGLAAYLGCSLQAVQALALYRRPAVIAPAFVEDVRWLARETGCDVERLAEVLWIVDPRSAMGRGVCAVPD